MAKDKENRDGLGLGRRAPEAGRATEIQRDDFSHGFAPGVHDPVMSQMIRITWWSNGTRAKEIEVELPERGKVATMEMYDQDKITVERR